MPPPARRNIEVWGRGREKVPVKQQAVEVAQWWAARPPTARMQLSLARCAHWHCCHLCCATLLAWLLVSTLSTSCLALLAPVRRR